MIFRFLFHLVPVVPLALGYYSLTVAAMLLVALPYIKVRKFEARLAGEDEGGGLRRPMTPEQLQAHRTFWLRWTFLPAGPAKGSE